MTARSSFSITSFQSECQDSGKPGIAFQSRVTVGVWWVGKGNGVWVLEVDNVLILRVPTKLGDKEAGVVTWVNVTPEARVPLQSNNILQLIMI